MTTPIGKARDEGNRVGSNPRWGGPSSLMALTRFAAHRPTAESAVWTALAIDLG